MEKERIRQACRLYAITDRKWITGISQTELLAKQVEQAILGGATMVQLREKELLGKSLKEEAIAVQRVCRHYHIPFIINDYVELAKELHADGVHVGQSDTSVKETRKLLGPDYIIGATAKTVEQARLACEQGADYLGSGAVFGSKTKLDAKPMSRETLKKIVKSVSVPVVAIGGIDGKNVTQLSDTHIAGIAVIGGIFGQSDIKEAARTLNYKLHFVL